MPGLPVLLCFGGIGGIGSTDVEGIGVEAVVCWPAEVGVYRVGLHREDLLGAGSADVEGIGIAGRLAGVGMKVGWPAEVGLSGVEGIWVEVVVGWPTDRDGR